MPVERFYLDQPLAYQALVKLEGTEFHHLAHVMRAKSGDEIELVDGHGNLAHVIVQQLTKHHALLKIEKVLHQPPRLYQLILAQALPKPNRLDFILEKGTELGVDTFWLFPGEKSIKKEFFPQQLERAQALTIAAMKQCGRLTLPNIVIYPPIKQWKELPPTSFFGDVVAGAPLFSSFKHQIDQQSTSLFITGPESGLSEAEVQYLKNLGTQGVKLHPHILRTDTASIMAISLLSHWLAD
jgi:16S rRNA (uracil1498-N3)-methyltransferase